MNKIDNLPFSDDKHDFDMFQRFFARYGEQAGEVTDEGLKTAGHMIGTAWTVLKIRKAFDPKKDSDKVSKKGKDKGVP
mgnify:CR=1 FL=1